MLSETTPGLARDSALNAWYGSLIYSRVSSQSSQLFGRPAAHFRSPLPPLFYSYPLTQYDHNARASKSNAVRGGNNFLGHTFRP